MAKKLKKINKTIKWKEKDKQGTDSLIFKFSKVWGDAQKDRRV